ncbi:MAG TPA: MarR family transcriptional regulator [Vicinamibacterales bacterium]|nr:MarR family transcriptional regulator [Vicinamibacterales bacterium]
MGTHHRGSAAEVAALNAYIKLRRAVGAIDARLVRALGEQGLTETQFGVLEVLYHLGPMCQRDIAAKQFTSGANMTMVVNNLEKNGLVRRVRGDEDRRQYFVELTPEGKGLIRKIFPAHVQRILAAFSALTRDEQAQLGTLCRKLGLANSRKGGSQTAK